MELALTVAGSALIGVVLGLAASRLVVPSFTRWYLERWLDKQRPPQGTRPSVRVHVLGVTYDVTDGLIRAPDENGQALWIIVGPAHVRMRRGDDVAVAVERPEPKDTTVLIRIVGPPDDIRFETPEQIREHYGITE